MAQWVESILAKQSFGRSDLVALLRATRPYEIEAIRKRAESLLKVHCGCNIYLRGLIEFSNVCSCDCLYCGLRRNNFSVARYTLSQAEIMHTARWCAAQGYGSLVLQSGERRDEAFIGFVEDVVRSIKEETRSAELPKGLGITLCVGEQLPGTYERFFAAGAHRYLLRIETSSPVLFKQLHPGIQTFEQRLLCLRSLKEAGFQVGTGVMIGLPGQTLEDLADDLFFFKEMDVDMIGMGPYITHSRTPMGRHGAETAMPKEETFRLSLLMIALARITMPDVNIAATTALDALNPAGREQGLTFGANVLMPRLTPFDARGCYALYEGLQASKDTPPQELVQNLTRFALCAGRGIALHQWGDSPRAVKRKATLK